MHKLQPFGLNIHIVLAFCGVVHYNGSLAVIFTRYKK